MLSIGAVSPEPEQDLLDQANEQLRIPTNYANHNHK
jgi:hypothetical protein